MDQLRTDIRFALRQLARSPGYAAIAILTLALGIGANSALYTLADTILRRPRPGVGDAGSLVWVGATTNARSRPTGVSYHVAERLREEVPHFEGVTTIRELPLAMGTSSEPQKVKGQAVSGDYFALLRTRFALGRGFTAAEDHAGGGGTEPVVVLSHQAWQTHFGADPSIVGRPVVLNGLPLTVVGVTAEGFNGAEHDDESRAAWVPSFMLAVLNPEWRFMVTDPASSNIRALARVREGVDRARVDTEVQRLASLIASSDSTRGEGWTLRVYGAQAGIPAGGEELVKPIAALSFAVTALILLICCANVSNLMLARALGRQREIATRLSIGASRARVVRQLLTEAVILAAAASVVGLLVATWGTSLVVSVALPLPLDLTFDGGVYAVSAALALGTGIIFGLAPALHATGGGVATVLREAGMGGGRQRSRLQESLVVAQVAFSLLLLTMSGLFLRSLDQARRIDAGFDASARVLALSFDIGLQRYDSVRAASFTDQLLGDARGLPGVESATLTDLLPLTQQSSRPALAELPGGGRSVEAPASFASVATAYFRTIGTPLLAGRDFSDTDGPGAPLVAIVSEGFARRHFVGIAPLGARVSDDGDDGPWRTVIGVARDAALRESVQDAVLDAVYVPLRQSRAGDLTLLVRGSGEDASALAPALRARVRALDPALPVFRLTTLDRVREAAMSEQRAGAAILAAFGGLALLLASVGLQGVMLFTVRRRTREIGIRMALGATARGVTTLVVRRGLVLTLIGGVIGVAMALGAGRLTRSLLVGVSPTDGVTFASVALLFAAVALLASWLPARRAARIDPVHAIRTE